MPPQIHIHYAAIVTAVVASFLFGWLWYGPLFGKKWASLMKMPTDCQLDPKVMMRSLGLTLIGTFLTAYVLAHAADVWRPSVWCVGTDGPSCLSGFCRGVIASADYDIPLLLVAVPWGG